MTDTYLGGLPPPRLHRLKTDPEVYQAVLAGHKTFEIRLNDRDFRVGDELLLMETTVTGEAISAGAPLQFTGNEMRKRVSHVLSGYGLMPGWVCLSFAGCHRAASVAERCKAEAHTLAEEAKTAWGRQDPKRLWTAIEALEARAATCLRAPTAQEKGESDELRELILLIRKLLNSPGDSWSHKAAEAIMAIHPAYAIAPAATAEPSETLVNAAREVVRTWFEDVPMSETADAIKRLDSILSDRAGVASLVAGEGTQASRDVLAERARQVSGEGWTPEHDDDHSTGDLSRAAAAYALRTACSLSNHPGIANWLSVTAGQAWPWDQAEWKPSGERRNLVKAGALILAEIERIDRASAGEAQS